MTLNIEEAERTARELLDGRMAAVRSLVEARQGLADLRAQVADAEREDARLYAAAVRDGWSADELRKIGLGEPEKVSRARKRAPQKPATPAPGSSPTH